MTIGLDLPRPDGFAKVTGRARYAGDQRVDGMVHGTFVSSTIPAGVIVAIDADAARAVAGVTHVLTDEDMPAIGRRAVPPLASSFVPMQSKDVRYNGQPIAIVLAETLEAAEEAARLVRVRYEASDFLAPSEGARMTRATPPGPNARTFLPPTFEKGDVATNLASAAYRLIEDYVQPSRHHNPMEPSSTLAQWEGDKLTMRDSVQGGYVVQGALAMLLELPPENIRVICPHTGGGFGCKGYVWPHQVLTALAARITSRPTRITLTRAQMYGMVGYQPRAAQRIELGASDDGRLSALSHETANVSGVSDDFIEFAFQASKGLYATPALRAAVRVERSHITPPTAMRAPVEGLGCWALESAMNELAHRLNIDPLDLRLANYADVDPADGKPWSSKKLREAYEMGAALFRWRDRPKTPTRDGHWLVGQGMASCTMGSFRFPASARVRLRADGSATVESGFQDIGSGTLTIFPQIAADALGLDPRRVGVFMGDTTAPMASMTAGSSSTAGVGSAVLRAAHDARAQLARHANLPPDDVVMHSGMIGRGAANAIHILDAMRAAGVEEIVGEGRFTLPQNTQFDVDGAVTPYAMRTFGAIFVEVGVDPALGLLRLRRAVGVYSAGRIINPRTARAQMTGGIIWGWGKAAMEASAHEPRLGRFLSKNLSGVAIPVNADIPADIDVRFVDEFDEHASDLGAKGIGELGATGVDAAVADAVFHAIGKRFRELPITPEKLI